VKLFFQLILNTHVII